MHPVARGQYNDSQENLCGQLRQVSGTFTTGISGWEGPYGEYSRVSVECVTMACLVPYLSHCDVLKRAVITLLGMMALPYIVCP